jgi:hypothetical protein
MSLDVKDAAQICARAGRSRPLCYVRPQVTCGCQIRIKSFLTPRSAVFRVFAKEFEMIGLSKKMRDVGGNDVEQLHQFVVFAIAFNMVEIGFEITIT